MTLFKNTHILLILSTMIACGDMPKGNSQVNAKEIREYLGNQDIKSKPHLKINNNAFKRDFMFYGSFIPMLKSPTGHSLKGRIVRFEIFADRVVMLESPRGLSIADKEQSIILLAEFPIIERDQDGIVIDFAKGMKSAFTTRNVHSRSISEEIDKADNHFKSIILTASFVRSIEANNNVLTISQIAQWRNSKSQLISAEFRYFFREYLPSSTFVKKSFGENRFVKYFSTPPQVEPPSTKPIAYIAKWDIAKPITFHISSNTPKKYLDAIQDGIKYWNHIFKREVLRTELLPKDVHAPHHNLNVLQWVEWDNEASAYADMVVDHISGQTIQAQVYLRSGWVAKSTKRLRHRLQELLLTEEVEHGLDTIEEGAPLPDMFDFEEPCYKALDDYQTLADLVEGLSTKEISNEVLDTLTADIIRTVTAHEMGHVLGLRHNLASSTVGNISLKERKDILGAYLVDGQPPLGDDKFLSISMMDVFSATDDALIGSQIREFVQSQDFSSSKLSDIYSYDTEAIAYGYYDKPMPGNSPFCSDRDVKKYLDCQRWDFSNTPALYSASSLNSTLTYVAIVLADTFFAAIDPSRKGGYLRIEDITLSYSKVMKNLALNIKNLFLWFNQNARSIQIEAKMPAFGPQNIEISRDKRFELLREQLDQAGLEATLFATVPPFRSSSQEPAQLTKIFNSQFLKLINEEKQKSPSFAFSQEDFDTASSIAFDFFSAINKDAVKLFAKVAMGFQFDDPENQLPIEKALGDIAREIIMAQEETSEPGPVKELPKFIYDLKTRDAAARMLSPGIGLLPDWSFDNLMEVGNSLKQLMRRHIGSSDSNRVDIGSLTREQRAWALEQNRILNALSKAKSMVRPLNPPTKK